jgi:hypothetical protein
MRSKFTHGLIALPREMVFEIPIDTAFQNTFFLPSPPCLHLWEWVSMPFDPCNSLTTQDMGLYTELQGGQEFLHAVLDIRPKFRISPTTISFLWQSIIWGWVRSVLYPKAIVIPQNSCLNPISFYSSTCTSSFSDEFLLSGRNTVISRTRLYKVLRG